MPKTNTATLPSNRGIDLINSLGGPPLPTGVSNTTLKVCLENSAAAETQLSSLRVASFLLTRRN